MIIHKGKTHFWSLLARFCYTACCCLAGLCLSFSTLNAQSCECTNCPDIATASSTTDFEFLAAGALNNDLSDPGQGICGVIIEFIPEHIWSLEMVLTSPNGTQVTLIGPQVNQFGFTGPFAWEITFLPCGNIVSPDPGFNPVWSNNQNWALGAQYNGSYYPNSGCLEDFNTGTVDGIWTLSVTNSSPLNTAEILDFTVMFCDDEGLGCFNCEAFAGGFQDTFSLVACQGDPSLVLDLDPVFGDTIPDSTLYAYTYIISQNDIIQAYDTLVDLTGYGGGIYKINGLSYYLKDSVDIPPPDGALLLSDIDNDLQGTSPRFCGDITDTCLTITIVEIDTTFLFETLCAGDTFFFGVDSLFIPPDTIINPPDTMITPADTIITFLDAVTESGTYNYDFKSYHQCDSVVELKIEFLEPITTVLWDSICAEDQYFFNGEFLDSSGVYTANLTSYQLCDSLVTLNLFVKDSIVTYLTEVICNGDSVQVGNFSYTSSGIHETTLTAANNCDSLVVLDLTVLDPVVSIEPADLLDCNNLTIILDATASSGEALMYQWTHLDNGGNGILNGENTATPEINQAGNYLLVITDTLGGNMCSVATNVGVASDLDPPHVAALGGTVSCFNPTTQLTGFSVTAGVTYNWSGPGNFSTTVQNPVVSTPGDYTLLVAGPNGCEAQTTVNVEGDTLPPQIMASASDTLDCSLFIVQLLANSTPVAIDYNWTGPNNYMSNQQNPGTSFPGNYHLTVIAQNGCENDTTITVIQDIEPPDVSALGDTLNCANLEVVLQGSSTTPGVSYSWTGPNNFTSTEQNPLVSENGEYILTVLAPNGCENTSAAQVEQNSEVPDVQAFGDTLDCQTTQIQLQGSSTTPGVSYSWTGPNNFTSTEQNPLVSENGEYILTVLAPNGCENSSAAQVEQDSEVPDVQAFGDTLDCQTTQIQLQGNSTTPGVSYSWTGPNNFTSTEQNPLVSENGEYILTVLAPNGCENSSAAQVEQDSEVPDVQAFGDTLDCQTTQIQLQGNSTTPGVSYSWTGPNNFTSTEQNPLVSENGEYILTVLAPNGCENSTAAQVEQDSAVPDVQAFGDTLDCQTTQIQLQGSSTTPGVSYSWTGPNNFTSTEQNPLVSENGEYILTVLAPNGCENSSAAQVEQDSEVPDVQAFGDTLDCQTTQIQLQGNSTTPGVSYSWTGPNNFTSTEQNPLVSENGEYILTVLAPNGCENSSAAQVEQDSEVPDVQAFGDTLDCQTTQIQLQGNSTTPGVSYSWTGPNNFTSTEQNPLVSENGEYILTVLAPNGCENSTAAQVEQDSAVPDVQAFGDTLDCQTTQIQLQGSSTTPGVSYSWTGPNNFTSTEQNPLVSENGEYILTVLAPNGCENSTAAQVEQNSEVPDVQALGDTLDCQTTQIQLQGSSTTPGVSYSWTGPNNFTSTEQNPLVSENGEYILTVLGPNGCENSSAAQVEQDSAVPDVQAFGDTLDCQTTQIQLQGNSTTPGVSYSWTGPNNFTSTEQNPLVSENGEYILTVLAPNGCENSSAAQVEQNSEVPDVQTLGDTLDCQTTQIQLQGNSTTPGVSYSWTGPNNFTSTEQNPLVSENGEYILTVLAPNGCENSTAAQVEQDSAVPDVQAFGDTLDCQTTQIQLQGSSTTPGVSYSWTGPNNFTSTEQNPLVSENGEYILTVLAPNGCENSSAAQVEQNSEVPDVQAFGDTLDCQITQIQLQGSSTTPGVSYSWTGPNNFTSTEQNPLVSENGEYILTVLAPNGCENSSAAQAEQDSEVPDVQAFGDTLDCQTTQIQLQGNSTTSGVSYSWTGPNNFTSTEQNPLVSENGEYILTVLAPNGCENSSAAQVEQDSEVPDVQAFGDTLDCQITQIQLQGSSTTPGVSYSWTGPNNFTSTEQNPLVSENGEYILTVLAPNGCENSSAAQAEQDSEVPDVQALGDTLDCQTTQIQLQGNSTTPGVSYSWTGPNNFTSTEQNPLVSENGEYILTVLAPNGCENSSAAQVEQDSEVPDVQALGDTLDCQITQIQLQGSSTTPGVSYSWTGPNNFTSTEQNPLVSENGEYILTVLAPNGCENSSSAQVEQDSEVPDVQALGDTLDCQITQIQLQGSSTTPGVSYSWTGPNNFTSTEQNPLVSENGEYILTVLAPNGCENSSAAQVEQDSAVPDVQAFGDTLDCQTTQIQLQGSSTTPGVSYSWTGPNNFTSTEQNPLVSENGEYILTVLAPNGCENSSAAQVEQDSAVPDVQAFGDTLDCQTTQIQLQGNSTTPGVSYSWTGPNNFTSTEQNPLVSENGEYILTVLAPNGCENSSAAQVEQNSEVPDVQTLGDTLDCQTTQIQLQGNSTTPGVSYSWTGPNNFTSTEQNPLVSENGEYILTVLAPNGCENSSSAQVEQDSAVPDVQALGDTLDCQTTQIQLQGNSTTPGVSYSWTGPNNFTSTEQNPLVSENGEYILTVLGPNGCENSSSAQVEQDSEVPDVQAFGDTLDCQSTQIQLQGNSTTPGVSYSWTGPNNFTSTEQNPLVSENGEYILTVLAPNGCENSSAAQVEQDSAVPDVQAFGDTLDCQTTQIQLQGNSTTPGVSYSWTGPNNFTSTEQNPLVSENGEYILTVLGPNGCENSSAAQVEQDSAVPDVQAFGDTLDCQTTQIQLQGNSTTPGVSYSWTGPNNFTSTEQNPLVSENGEYILTVLAPNGCENSSSAQVEQDSEVPDVQAFGDTLDCQTTQIQLQGNSTTPGVSYSWTGPNNFTSTEQNPLVSENGEYILTVLGPNGCENSSIAQVEQDSAVPDVQTLGDTLDCQTTQIQLQGSSTTPGVSYSWTGPNNFTSTEQNPLVSENGEYILTVLAPNGCENSSSAQVEQDSEVPDVQALGDTLDCQTTQIQLQGSSTTPGVSYSWTGPNNFTSTEQNPLVSENGEYILTVLAPNGCENSSSAQVEQDSEVPDVQALGDTLDCQTTQIQLQGSSTTPGVSYSWTGPNNFTSTEQNPLISENGEYILTVLAPNGCENSTAAQVEQDSAVPDVQAFGDTLDCQTTQIQLQGNSTTPGVSYSWTGPNNFTSTEQNPLVSENGEYILTVLAPNGCENSSAAQVEQDIIEPIAQIDTLGGQSINCQNTSLLLSSAGSSPINELSFEWLLAGDSISNEIDLQIEEGGEYALIVVNQTNACVDTAYLTIIADFTAPIAEAGEAANLDCENPVISLNGAGSSMGIDFSYEWTGPGILNGIASLTPEINESGVYNLLVTNLQNGCTAMDQVTVEGEANTLADVRLIAEDPDCFNDNNGSIEISEIVGGTEPFVYSIDNQVFIQNNYFGNLTAGTYELNIMDAMGCEWDTVIYLSNPSDVQVELGEDITITLGDSVQLDPQLSIPFMEMDTFSWQQSDEGFCLTCFDQWVNPTTESTYSLTVINEAGCRDSDEITIRVDKKRLVYIPNAFSPDHDGINDLFIIHAGQDVRKVNTLRIFNRWGATIFERSDFPPNDAGFGWDGTLKGEPLNPAVFVFYAEIEFIDGRHEIYQGDITLLK